MLTLHSGWRSRRVSRPNATTNDGDIGKFYPYPRSRRRIACRSSPASWTSSSCGRHMASPERSRTTASSTRHSDATRRCRAARRHLSAIWAIGDSAIRPEQETEIETGFDATLLNSRAQFSFTVYQKRITDLLLQDEPSPSLGFDQAWINGGEFTNQGIELQLTATPLQLHNGFQWVSTTSFFRNYSVVNSLPVPAFDLYERRRRQSRAPTASRSGAVRLPDRRAISTTPDGAADPGRRRAARVRDELRQRIRPSIASTRRRSSTGRAVVTSAISRTISSTSARACSPIRR